MLGTVWLPLKRIDFSIIVSMSEVQLEARSDSKASSLSMESGMRTGVPSSAPTPTWTEGTPSYTESSSSGDLGTPHSYTHALLSLS